MSDATTNGHAKRNYSPMRLAEAGERTPAPRGLGAWAEEMRAAAMDAVAPDDVNAIIAKQVEQAKEGDTAAAKFVLGFISKATPPAPSAAQMVRISATETPAEPPKVVAVDGPGVDQQRRLVAFVLLAHQPMSVAGLGAQTGLSGEQLEAVLNHDWFHRQGGTVKLTPLGRNTVG